MAIEFDIRDAKPTLRPIPHIVLPQLYMAVLLALRLPTAARMVLGLPYLYALYYVTAEFSAHNVFFDFLIGTSLWFQVFNLFPLDVFSDSVYYAKDKNARPIGSHSFPERVWLYLCLLWNPRCVGWSCQVPFVPKAPTAGRWTFVFQRIVEAAFWLGVLALNDFTHFELPAWYAANVSDTPRALQIIKYVDTLASCFVPVALFKFSSVVPSIFCVATGLFVPDPANWPDMFNSITEAFTLRRYWGRYWQQTFRRYITAWTGLVVKTLGLKRGSFVSGQIQTHAAFFLSGLIHIGGDTMMLGKPYGGVSLSSLVIIASMISAEDTVTMLAHDYLGLGHRADGKRGPTLFWRLAGYVWVLYLLVTGGLGYVSQIYDADHARWGWLDVFNHLFDLRFF